MSEFSNISKINSILDDEKKSTKHQCWSKLSKKEKYEKLLIFSEKYCQKNDCDKKTLDTYIKQSIDRKKLNKKTDVKYNKDTQEVTDVPGLQQHPSNRAFTIRADTSKRPSTLKSLTPKRITERNRNSSNQNRAKEKQAKEDKAKEEAGEKTEKIE